MESMAKCRQGEWLFVVRSLAAGSFLDERSGEERRGADCHRIDSGNGTNNKHKGNKRAFYRCGVSVWEGLVVGVLPQSLTDPPAATSMSALFPACWLPERQ